MHPPFNTASKQIVSTASGAYKQINLQKPVFLPPICKQALLKCLRPFPHRLNPSYFQED
jgi:hypothetical protein